MMTTDTDTVELWSPITDEGMSMTPCELIVEFMDLISDRNSQTGNPYLYVMPLPGHGRHRQATAQGERASGIRQQVEAKEQE